MPPSDGIAMALAALGMGLLGSPHCVGMCGGIAGALAPAGGTGSGALGAVLPPLLLSLGRVSSYALLGGVAGGFGWLVEDGLGADGTLLLRVAFGALMAAVGFSLAGWLAGLGWLEAVGSGAWRRLSPILGRVLPADRAWKQLAAGAVWGWLPCGLVYAALAGATASGSGLRGAGLMVCFGLGTLPAVAGMGMLAGGVARFMRRPATRRLVGATLIAFGIWTAVGPLIMRGAHQHGSAQSPSEAVEPQGTESDHQHH